MEPTVERGKAHSSHHSHSLEQASQADSTENSRKHPTGSHKGHAPAGQQSQHTANKRLGRTPSSPSVFFSKVKERIREKVYETSAEWPHMAAIVQERRQRAADAFEARMSIRRQQNTRVASVSEEPGLNSDDPGHKGSRRGRIKSDQTVHHHKASPSSSCGSSCSNTFDKESAKSAFRRRSISEDTYNRQPGSSQRPEDRGGVVCSNDELRAMVFEHKLRRSPIASKHPEKGSSSLECCQESVSCESLSNNSVSSSQKLPMFRDGSLFPSNNSKDAPQVFPHHTTSAVLHQELVAEINADNSCPVLLTITSADDGKTANTQPRSPEEVYGGETRRNSVVIREIVFDEHGQTWDIYGAEFDPEILGQAIQSHLEKIMKKKMVDQTKLINVEPSICLRSDSPNECRPMCANGEGRTTQRALGFFLRYLCSVARRK